MYLLGSHSTSGSISYILCGEETPLDQLTQTTNSTNSSLLVICFLNSSKKSKAHINFFFAQGIPFDLSVSCEYKSRRKIN